MASDEEGALLDQLFARTDTPPLALLAVLYQAFLIDHRRVRPGPPPRWYRPAKARDANAVRVAAAMNQATIALVEVSP